MKWILIIVLICVIMVIAKALSDQFIDKFNFYYNLKQFLTQFKHNLAFKQNKIMEFLENVKAKKQFNIFIEKYKEFLVNNKLDLTNIKILEDEERKELEDIVKNIGKMDAKNEINQLESFLNSIDCKLQKAEADKIKLSPMILKLSLLFAIGLAILLI